MRLADQSAYLRHLETQRRPPTKGLSRLGATAHQLMGLLHFDL